MLKTLRTFEKFIQEKYLFANIWLRVNYLPTAFVDPVTRDCLVKC